MRRQRQAKIVATLGPASDSRDMIQALFQAGADVFRFNFSHGSHADHQARYQIVREVEQRVGRPIAILADLQGPKLRVGQFSSGKVTLEAGQEFTLDSDTSPGDQRRVCLPHPELFAVIGAGQSLLLDDGKLRLQVLDAANGSIRTRVVNGGVLSDRKGVNVPDAVLPIPALTEKRQTRSGVCTGTRGRLDCLVVRAAAGRCTGSAGIGGGAGGDPVQAGKAGGIGTVGRNRASLGRHHGGAR